MKEVLQALASFFAYAVMAVFAQNAVFTRALGVSRVVKLVDDGTVDTVMFGSLLCALGFALGSGVGYVLAVVVVMGGEKRLESEKIPAMFRGLPITLLYIGILALAIYGFTGHMAAF